MHGRGHLAFRSGRDPWYQHYQDRGTISRALDRITELFDAETYYPECHELEFLGMLVEAYEAKLP